MSVTGVQNGQNIAPGVSISWTATATLNEQAVSSPLVINEPGFFILVENDGGTITIVEFAVIDRATLLLETLGLAFEESDNGMWQRLRASLYDEKIYDKNAAAYPYFSVGAYDLEFFTNQAGFASVFSGGQLIGQTAIREKGRAVVTGMELVPGMQELSLDFEVA